VRFAPFQPKEHPLKFLMALSTQATRNKLEGRLARIKDEKLPYVSAVGPTDIRRLPRDKDQLFIIFEHDHESVGFPLDWLIEEFKLPVLIIAKDPELIPLQTLNVDLVWGLMSDPTPKELWMHIQQMYKIVLLNKALEVERKLNFEAAHGDRPK
jgi:hypothetical protein